MNMILTANQQAQVKKIVADFHSEVDAVVSKHRKKINSLLEKISEQKLKQLRQEIQGKK